MLRKYTLTEADGYWTTVAPGIRRKLIHTEHLMMVIVEFINGPAEHPDPFHHHRHEQVSYVAEGELVLHLEGVGEQILKEGEMFAIPSGLPHAVRILTPVVRIIDSFTPVREDFL